MMKKYNICKIAFISLTLLTLSCKDFLDVNEDLDSPVRTTPNYLLPPIQSYLATQSFDQGDITAYFTQQLATQSGTSALKDKWNYLGVNRTGTWRRHFFDIGGNVIKMRDFAVEEGSKNYEGVALIILALSLQTTTDLFGDMPYFNAFQGNPSPKYDEQSIIYDELVKNIEKAIEVLKKASQTDRSMTAKQDNIYAGNTAHWIRLAYAIKARILLHLTPNVNKNYDNVLAATNHALEGNLWTDALYDYTKGDGSALQTNQWGPSKADPGWDFGANILNASAPTPFLLNALKYDPITKVTGDPRLKKLMKPNEDDEFLSISSGTGKEISKVQDDYPDLYGAYMTKDDAPGIIFTKEELYFIQAEAYFQKTDKNAALEALKNAIVKNMERWGVEIGKINSFLSTYFSTPSNLTLSNIMMQKYIALYLQSEIWVDMRRYGYDPEIYTDLTRTNADQLASYWSATDTKDWIERLPYDKETEEVYNKPELDRLGAYQSSDWLRKPMFWAKPKEER